MDVRRYFRDKADNWGVFRDIGFLVIKLVWFRVDEDSWFY